jgi:hypothetical protein
MGPAPMNPMWLVLLVGALLALAGVALALFLLLRPKKEPRGFEVLPKE